MIIDKLALNNSVYDLSAYGMVNYANRIILVGSKFYMFNDNKLSLIKNKNTISDLVDYCCRKIRNKEVILPLIFKYDFNNVLGA